MADSEQDTEGRVVQISGTSYGQSNDRQGKQDNDNTEEVEDG